MLDKLQRQWRTTKAGRNQMGLDTWKEKMALGTSPFIAFCLRGGTSWYYPVIDKGQIKMFSLKKKKKKKFSLVGLKIRKQNLLQL